MKYFSILPKIYYDLTGNKPATPLIATNIMARARIIPDVLNNAMVYYTYDVKDTDTPEIIAEKYYDDSGLHWLVLMTNNIVDPFYDWPLPYEEFMDFIEGKYGSISTAQTTIDHYTKTISKYDSQSRQTFSQTYTIDLTTYNSLPATEVDTINLKNGTVVTQTITRAIVYAFDAEFAANEANRTIKLIDKQYVGEIVKELKSLMS